MPARPASGRPEPGEYAAYVTTDIDRVPGDDVIAALEAVEPQTIGLFAKIGEKRTRGFSYAAGKWTIKEVLGHICDDERIFTYRALCLARGEQQPLAGFDENVYAAHARFEDRTLEGLLDEYRAIRAATLSLYVTLTPEALVRTGEVNDYRASARGLGFHIVGHELHHLEVLRERYLPLLPS